MKRNILFLILVVLLDCVYATAETFQWGCGDNLTCSLSEEQVLVISGTGVVEHECSSCPYSNQRWTSIVIKNGVTGIGETAFYNSNLESITIPNSVTSIGATAFSDCKSLKSIVIPKSVTNIGKGLFLGCRELKSIKVEAGNSIYDSRNNCNAIIETATNKLIAGVANTTIPNSVTIIGADAFIGCVKLTSITIPNSVTTIEDEAFAECGLESIIIPDGVTKIGKYAFCRCQNLTSITIPNSVVEIGENAFKRCESLSISLPERFKDKVDVSSCANVTYY